MTNRSKQIDLGGNDLIVNSLLVGASAPGQAGTDIGTTDLTALAGVTAGTVTASKVLIVDSGKKLSGLLNATLGAGTATVAPLNFTSGTNLTTATAGAVEYDGNAFYATSQASSRSVLDAEQYIIQAADSTADNNTILDTAVAGAVFSTNNGAITLVAGKTYIFEGVYNLTNTGTTSHTWATLFGGTATFNAAGTAYQAFGNSGVTANTPATGGLSGFFTGATVSTAVVVTAASTSATEQVCVQVQGTLSCLAGGTLIPQMKASARPGASGTPGVVHKAGNFFRIWQVPTLGSVGNWS
jgi:hypothetical protein